MTKHPYIIGAIIFSPPHKNFVLEICFAFSYTQKNLNLNITDDPQILQKYL